MDEEAYQTLNSLWQLFPAQHQRLTKESAVTESKRWYLRTAIRDAIELTNVFIEECWLVCSLFGLGAKGQFTGEEYNHLVTGAAKKFHSLGLPVKLKQLKEQFEVFSDLEQHVLTMNTARACLVHRLGRVTDLDVDSNGELQIVWRVLEIFAQSADGKSEFVIDKPGTTVEGGWTVKMRATDKRRVFRKGDVIDLSYDEITHTLFSLTSFAMSLVQSIEQYARRTGIEFSSNEIQEAQRYIETAPLGDSLELKDSN